MWFKDIGKFATDKIKSLSNKNNDIPLDELLKNIDVKKDKKYDYAQSLQSILSKTPTEKLDIKSLNTGWETDDIDINFNEKKSPENKIDHNEPRKEEIMKKEKKSNNDERLKENAEKTQKQTVVMSDKESFENLLMKDFESENNEKSKIFSKFFGISSYLTKTEKNEKFNASKKIGEENLQELLEENKYLEEKLQNTLIQSNQLDLLLKIEKEEFEEYKSIESEKLELLKKDLESQAEKNKNKSQELATLEKKIIFKKKIAEDEAKLDDIILENLQIQEISNELAIKIDKLNGDHIKEIDQANMTITDLNTKNTNIELKLKNSFVKLAAASQTLKEQLTNFNSLKTETSSLKNYMIEERKINWSLLKANLNEYSSKYVKMNEKILEAKHKYNSEIERLNESLSLSKKNEKSLENKLKNLEINYQQQFLMLEQALTESSLKNNHLLNENLVLNQKIEGLSENLTTLKKENLSNKRINDENEANHKKKNLTLEKELQSFIELDNKLKNFQNIYEELDQKFIAQKKLNQEISQKKNSFEKDEEIIHLKNQLGQSKEIINNLEKNINSRDNKIVYLELEIQNFKKELEESNDKNNLKYDIKSEKKEEEIQIQENHNWEVDDDILLDDHIDLEPSLDQNERAKKEAPKNLEEITLEPESVDKRKENEKSNKIFEENEIETKNLTLQDEYIFQRNFDINLVAEIQFEKSVELRNDYKILETNQKDEFNEIEEPQTETKSEEKIENNNELDDPPKREEDSPSDSFFKHQEIKEEELILNHEENLENKNDLKEDELNISKQNNLPDFDQNLQEDKVHHQEIDENIFKEEISQAPVLIPTLEQKQDENFEDSNHSLKEENNETMKEKNDENNLLEIKFEESSNEKNKLNYEIQIPESPIDYEKNFKEEVFYNEENPENKNQSNMLDNQDEPQALLKEKMIEKDNEIDKNLDVELNFQNEIKNEEKVSITAENEELLPSKDEEPINYEKTSRSPKQEELSPIKSDNSLDINPLNNFIERKEEDSPKNETIQRENNFQPLEEDSFEAKTSNKEKERKNEDDQKINETNEQNEINLHPEENNQKSVNIQSLDVNLFQSKEINNAHDWDIDDLKLDDILDPKNQNLLDKELDLPRFSSVPKNMNEEEFFGSIKASHNFTYNLQKALEMSKSDAKTVEEIKFDDDLFGAHEKSQYINLSNEKDVKSCSAFSAQHSPQKSIESKPSANIMEVKSNNDFFSSGFKNESLEQKSLLVKKTQPVLSSFVINKNLMNNLKNNLSTNDMKHNLFDLNKKKDEDIDLFSLLGNNKRK